MATAESQVFSKTATVNTDTARIDALKEQLRSTPWEVDYARHLIMRDSYEETVGYQEVIRRARLMEAMVEHKGIYIDDNLFVGSITGKTNGVYPYPEWNVEWMKEEKTVENSKTPELKAANEWALDYWDKRSLKTRTEEILARRYGYDVDAIYGGGLVSSFHDWPGGGGNLDYPLVYQQGLASVIKDVRRAANVHGDAFAERIQALLLRGSSHHDAGAYPPGSPLCRAGS